MQIFAYMLMLCFMGGIGLSWASGNSEPGLDDLNELLQNLLDDTFLTSVEPASNDALLLGSLSGSTSSTSLDESETVPATVCTAELNDWVTHGEADSILTALEQRRLLLPDAGPARSLLMQFADAHPTHLAANDFAGLMVSWNIMGPDHTSLPEPADARPYFARIATQPSLRGTIAALEIAFAAIGARDANFDTAEIRGLLSNELWQHVLSPSLRIWGPLIQQWGDYMRPLLPLSETDPLFTARAQLEQAFQNQEDLDFRNPRVPAFAMLYSSWWRLRSSAMAGYQPARDLYWRIVQTPYQTLRRISSSQRLTAAVRGFHLVQNATTPLLSETSAQGEQGAIPADSRPPSSFGGIFSRSSSPLPL
jgi:hypothetical protein